MVTDGADASDCTSGAGGTDVRCTCGDAGWATTIPSSQTLQQTVDNSGTTPTLTAGTNGLKLAGFNSLTKAVKQCNTAGTQCKNEYIDESGVPFETYTLPVDLVTKLYSTKFWEIRDSSDNALLKITDAGVVTGSAGIVSAFNKSASDVTISNTVTETTLYSVTIPANTLGTAGCVRVSLSGQGLNNVGTAQSFAMRIKYGGSAGTSTAITENSSASARYSDFVGRVCGNGTTGTQVVVYTWTLAGDSSASSGTLAIDSTVDQTLLVAMTLSTASASMTWTHDHGMIEKLP